MRLIKSILFLIVVWISIQEVYSNELIERKIILNPKDFNLDSSFPFYFERLINAQNEKFVLGRKSNDQLLVFNNTIENEFSSFFQQKLPFSNDKLPLIIKVNRITVVAGFDNSSVDLSLTFYSRVNNSYVEILQTSAYMLLAWRELFNSFERKNGENILNSFEKCFLDLQNRFQRGSLRNRPVAMDELSIPAPFDETTFPILSPTQKPSKGVFHNFSDFIDLNADTSVHFFQVENNTNLSDFKFAFSQPIASEIWGGFDGENYFIRFMDRFFKLEVIDGKLFMIFNDADRRSLFINVNDGLTMGGLTNPLTVSGRDGKELVYRVRIDWYAGRIVRDNLEIFILNNTKRRLGAIEVYFDEKKVTRLDKDEYFKIDYVPPRGLTKLGIRIGEHTDQYLFNPMYESFFFIRKTKKGVKILKILTPADEIKAYLLYGKREIKVNQSH
jgi:hypothetical protein